MQVGGAGQWGAWRRPVRGMEQEGGVDGAGPIWGYGPAPENGDVGVVVAQVPHMKSDLRRSPH